MTGMVGDEDRAVWWRFIRKHWGAVAIFAAAAILAVAGAVYVFWWFAGDAQSTGLVPSSLGSWTMANVVAFILNVIFYELLIIGVPVVVAGVIGWLWWKRLAGEERRGFHMRRRPGKTRGGGGGSLLFFIAFCIKVYLDGNWNKPIATWTLDYVVGSMILILEWVAVIFGIPIAIALIWWIRRETRRQPTQTIS